MRRTIAAAAALALGLMSAPHASAEDTPAGDLGKLQGKWTATVGPQKQFAITMTVKGAKVRAELTVQGEDLAVEGEFKLDDKASPKTVDWVKFKNPQGEDVPDNKGIYRFSDDGATWTVCNGGPGNDRPSEFKAGDQGAPNLIEFKKVDDKPAPKPEAPKGDLAKFQGKWKASVNNGQVQIRLTIKGDAIDAKWSQDGNEVELKGKFKLNESATPKTIDFVEFKRPDGEDMPDNPGIYVIDGESITVCAGGGGNARPAEFKAGEGGQPTLFTLEKVKE